MTSRNKGRYSFRQVHCIDRLQLCELSIRLSMTPLDPSWGDGT